MLFAGAYLPRLTVATLLPDELVYLEAGAALVAGDAAANPEHPPLAKLLFGLAQTAVPDPVLAVRLVGVAAGAAIAVALALLVGRGAGRRWGLAAAGAWALLPHALRVPGQPLGGFDQLDRYGMLDPVATALAMGALVAAVRWFDDRRPRWMLLAGALLGLAAAAKLPALLFLPVLLFVPVVSRAWRPRVILTAWSVLGAAVVVAFVAAFLPLGGQAPQALAAVFTLQGEHRAGGHPIVLGGVLHQPAPWWANLAYQWRDDGPLLTAALVVAAVAGGLGGRSPARLRVLLAGAVVVPVAGLAMASVALPHYRFLWLPPLVALAVLGVRSLVGRGRAERAVAVGVVAVAVGVGGATVAHTVTRQPSDYRVVADLVDRLDVVDPRVVVVGYPRVLGFYAPGVRSVRELPADVVVLDPKVTARRPVGGLRADLAAAGYRRIDVDRLEVWLPPAR